MLNMKKIIASMLLILIIINFILLSTSSYASSMDVSDELQNGTYFNKYNPSQNVGEQIGENGETQGRPLTLGGMGMSLIGALLGILAKLINWLIALELDVLIGQATFSNEDGELQYFITIDRIVYNRVPVLNANYFNFDSSYKIGKNIDIEADVYHNQVIKKNMARVYYMCRTLSLLLGLAVLVYVGIRMALSTMAIEQAKYKKMFISWVESIIIIFLIPYIISALFVVGESLTRMFYDLRCSWLTKYGISGELFENNVRNKALSVTFKKSGLSLVTWSIIYWILLYIEIKFLWTYIKRFFMIGFLIAIAPLVTITYSIDKAGDGRAQAFSNWTKEMIINVLIQPLHALIYLVIIVTANNIVLNSPTVAILLLLSIEKKEKMVRTIFNINDTATFNGIKGRLLRKG